MANLKSAIKRNRQSIKRRDRNREARAAIRSAMKDARAAADSGNKAKAQELLKSAEKLIAKAANKKLYHSSNASRKVSRLAVYVAKKTAK
jgi:small subunit ribosomal protein S20